MSMLESPGLFTMPLIPDDWTASKQRENPVYELQPATRDAAVHISIYRRTEPVAPAPGQARDYLLRFVNQQPTEVPPRVVVVPPKADEHRAFAMYRNKDEDGRLREWFAGCIVWPEAMLMCSANAAPGSRRLKEAETMITSIFKGTETSD